MLKPLGGFTRKDIYKHHGVDFHENPGGHPQHS